MPPTKLRQLESADAVAGVTRVSLEELIALRMAVSRAAVRRRPPTRSALSGGHLSRFRARGMDYAESRVYQAGDDIRAMDWRLTARSGRAHTKLFREERERSLYLLFDLNPTMRFGTRVRFKSVQAARVAALAAWSLQAQGDRVGAVAFGRIQATVHARGGRRGVLSVLGALAEWDRCENDGGAEEPLDEALRRVRRVAHSGSRVLLISDGQCVSEGARAALLRLRQHAELACLLVADALESTPPPAGRYAFETAGRRWLVSLQGKPQRLAFADTLGRGQRELASLCDTCGVPWRRIDTAQDPMPALAALLGMRRGVRR